MSMVKVASWLGNPLILLGRVLRVEPATRKVIMAHLWPVTNDKGGATTSTAVQNILLKSS